MARKVELWIDGAWTDVTAGDYVLADDPITVNRGAGAETSGGVADPGSSTFTLLDRAREGRWSGRAPGPNYRKIGRNTPVRISDGADVRAVHEISEWSPRWDAAEGKVAVPVQATGILARLIQGRKLDSSPVFRGIMDVDNDADRVAYWPLEDGGDSTSFTSPMAGVNNATFSGEPDLARFASPGSKPLPTLAAGSAIVAPVPTARGGEVKVVTLWDTPTGSVPDTGVMMRLFCTGGTVALVDLLYGTAGGGALSVIAYSQSSAGYTVIDQTPFVAFAVNNIHFLTSLELTQSGANLSVLILKQKIVAAAPEGSTFFADTFAGCTLGRVTSIVIAPHGDIDGMSVGHLAIARETTCLGSLGDAIVGFSTETAGRRIERLLAENGVPFTAVGNLDDTAAMGPQRIGALVDLLADCATADQGLVYETRGALGLSYRTRTSMYNQVGPAVAYAGGYVMEPLEPSEDVSDAWNDVTVTRPGGGSARSVLDGVTVPADPQHTLTTQDPPDGIGTYDRGSLSVAVASDDQLQPLADWLRHIGTWDEWRWRRLEVEFAAPELAADPATAAELAALESGDQLRLTGLPVWCPPGDVALHVRGSVEELRTHTRRLSWNLVPGSPMEVWQLDGSGSTLVAPVAAGATSMKLDMAAGPEWQSTAGGAYYLQAFGNAFKVSSISTDTPAFIAAGVPAHGTNASVVPALPAGMTVNVGQALYCLAAIRNSGTGTVDLPAGWIDVANFGNMRLFARYYVTGVTAPTVTFTGGVANATTSAVLFGWSGLSIRPEFVQTQLNASAQDVAFPAGPYAPAGRYNRRNNRVIFWAAWKQDDYTSAALVTGGVSETFEASSALGDDQSLTLDHFLQATAAPLAAFTMVITGGAAAISRGMVVALRPLQTATVVRNVNGVNTAIAAGQAVNGWRLGVNGL